MSNPRTAHRRLIARPQGKFEAVTVYIYCTPKVLCGPKLVRVVWLREAILLNYHKARGEHGHYSPHDKARLPFSQETCMFS